MKNKIIFELKLNSKDSIIAYEKNDYDSCYEDSMLYINIDGEKTKIAEHSFCYIFGADMYYRIYNVKDFSEDSNFAVSLKDYYNTIVYNDEYNPDDPSSFYIHSFEGTDPSDYDFAYGNSTNNLGLYLFKNKNEYTLMLIKLWQDKSTKKHETKTISEYRISKDTFAEWKALISTEWEKRTVIEGEKIPKAKGSKEDWQKHFEFMRSDKKRN